MCLRNQKVCERSAERAWARRMFASTWLGLGIGVGVGVGVGVGSGSGLGIGLGLGLERLDGVARGLGTHPIEGEHAAPLHLRLGHLLARPLRVRGALGRGAARLARPSRRGALGALLEDRARLERARVRARVGVRVRVGVGVRVRVRVGLGLEDLVAPWVPDGGIELRHRSYLQTGDEGVVHEGHLAPARTARRPPHHARVAARAARPTR